MNVSMDQEVQVNRFFSDFAETWDTLYGGKRNAFWRYIDNKFRRDIYERYQLTFEQLGPDLTGKKILDIGCGSGIYCVEAARRNASTVVGIDISENMVNLARAHSSALGFQGTCSFASSVFPADRHVELLSQRFTHAIVMGVMDYVQDLDRFMKALRPTITEFAVLSFPGKHWFREPFRRYRYRLLGRCEIYNYTEQSILNACVGGGFRNVNILRLPHSGITYIVTAYA